MGGAGNFIRDSTKLFQRLMGDKEAAAPHNMKLLFLSV